MKRTQMYNWHKEHGKMVSFAGFEIPVLYSSIKQEHMAVRDNVGIFDVSHMGRLFAEGIDVLPFFNTLVPRDLEKLAVGRGAYSFVLNEHAGFRDDVVLFRLSETRYMLVWNAGNLEKIPMWISNMLAFVNQLGKPLDIQIQNIAAESAMFAVQGPNAVNLVEEIFTGDIPTRWGVSEGNISSSDVILSRTGYTGEDGFEISILDSSYEYPLNAETVWNSVLESSDVEPCGLGARDSLRLESGFSLYGNDIYEDIDPVSADLCFPPFIHLNKDSFFMGKERLLELNQNPPTIKRVGFVSTEKGPSPRPGMPILNETGEKIGNVTSGSFSPLLEIGVGMGYLMTEYIDVGTMIAFEHRGKHYPMEVKKFPLYDANKYGHARKV